jgi:hypothetical protein
VSAFSSRNPDKIIRDALTRLEVKAYLANGGQIQVIPPGICKDSPVKTFQEQNALAWRKRNAD